MAKRIAGARAAPLRAAIAGLGSAVAWLVAGAVGLVLTLVFAATLMVVVLGAAAFFLAAILVLRLRGPARPRDGDVIEARHIGGHSWVAYGWDTRA